MAAVGDIGVGIVGYGLAGRSFHAPYIATVDGLRVAAIATSDPGRQERARAEHPGAAILSTVDALLEHPDVELVVVASPNRSHAPIATRALAAGRHVVVDKPLAMDVAEAEALVAGAAQAGRILSVYQNRRWDGDFQTVRALIDDGRLGTIDSFEARFERWSALGDEWRETAEQAGGPHRDLGAHLVDQSLLLFGPAGRVFAQIDRRREGTAVDDSVFVATDHRSGVRSRLWMSLIASHIGPRLRVRGTAGEYVKQDLDVQERQLAAGMRPDADGFGVEAPERWGTLYRDGEPAEAIPTERGDYGRFYALLRDAIRDGGAPPVDPLDAIRALRVLEAAEQSARTGSAVAIVDTSP